MRISSLRCCSSIFSTDCVLCIAILKEGRFHEHDKTVMKTRGAFPHCELSDPLCIHNGYPVVKIDSIERTVEKAIDVWEYCSVSRSDNWWSFIVRRP